MLQIKQREREMRLLVLGLDGAGKTTVCQRLSGESIEEVQPTLGFRIQTLKFLDYTLHLWDVGGQATIRAYWRNYFEGTDGLVFVLDCSDRMRMELVRQELFKLLQQERLAGASLLIFANKQDVDGALSGDDISQALDLQDMKGRHWRIVPCSAVTEEGLALGMEWIVRDIASRIFMLR